MYSVKLGVYSTPHDKVDSRPILGPAKMQSHARKVIEIAKMKSFILKHLRSAVAFETLFLSRCKYVAKLI